jgi:hypothetical protein
MLITEELAWAMVREREEEARRMRPHVEHRPVNRSSLRSRLARKLVHAGLHLDGTAGESVLKTVASGRC